MASRIDKRIIGLRVNESIDKIIDNIHKEFIEDMLRSTYGNIYATAKAFNIPYTTLKDRITRFGISREDFYPDCPDCGVGRTGLGPKLINSNKNDYFRCLVCDEYFNRQTLKKLEK